MEKIRYKPIGGIPSSYSFDKILSDSTKEGTVYLLTETSTSEKYVMKVFAKTKSPKTIAHEIKMQKAFYPYSPKIMLEGKNYFIMEYGTPAVDILKKDPKMIYTFVRDFLQLISFELTSLLSHNDTKLDNIIYLHHRFLFIDFGFTRKSKNCKEIISVLAYSIFKIHKQLSPRFEKEIQALRKVEQTISKLIHIPSLFH